MLKRQHLKAVHRLRGVQPLESRQVLAVIIVDSLADIGQPDGLISLREAILAANNDTIADPLEGIQAGSGADTIMFAPTLVGGSITVSRPTEITDALTIVGPDNGDLHIDFQHPLVIDNNDVSVIDVAIYDLDLGNTSRIESAENLLIERSAAAGMIRMSGSTQLSIIDSQFAVIDSSGDNPSVTVRSAVPLSGFSILRFESIGGSLELVDSQFLNASTGIEITTVDAEVMIRDSIISGHQLHGIVLETDGEADVRIEGSTIANNGYPYNASGGGGGILWKPQSFGPTEGRLSIVNTTISGNVADDGGGILFQRGGDNATLEIRHSTIVNNASDEQSPSVGVEFPLGDPAIAVSNSLLSGNQIIPENDPNDFDASLVIADLFDYNFVGYSLFPSYTASLGVGNVVGGADTGPIDPRLGPLADSGGSTLTHAIGPLSPALNAGDPNFMEPPPFDQRGAGFDRVVGGRLDMGAFEFQAANGDFVDNGLLNCEDVDALVAEIAAGSNNLNFDLTTDGLVNTDDLDLWITSLYGTLPGDGNLDGVVDVSDFNLWNANKFTNTAAWCAGDFNADGVIDVSDFNIWNADKFQTVFSLATGLTQRPPQYHRATVMSEAITMEARSATPSSQPDMGDAGDVDLPSYSQYATINSLSSVRLGGR